MNIFKKLFTVKMSASKLNNLAIYKRANE